ncbi:MAG: hypothetical protein ABSC06_35890, partial [Rhodopila sp.]
ASADALARASRIASHHSCSDGPRPTIPIACRRAAVQSNPFLAHRRARYLRALIPGNVRRAAKLKTLFIIRTFELCAVHRTGIANAERAAG